MAMPQPGQQANMLKNAAGAALVFNELTQTSEFEVNITLGTAGAATNLLIIPGPVPTWLNSKFSCAQVNQTATTGQLLSSTVSAADATGYAEFKQYLQANSMVVDYVRILSSNTSVYDGNLFMGEMPVNGIASPKKIPLQAYANSLGSGSYDKTLIIRDKPFVITRNFFMYISSVFNSSTLSFAFGVSATSSAVAVQQA